jgi:hypothetical protein
MTWDTAGTRTYPSSSFLTQFLTGGKWWPLWIKWEQATAKQWWTLQQPPNCEFRTWIVINIDQLHHLKISWYSHMCFFSHFDSIPHQCDKWWPLCQIGTRNSKTVVNIDAATKLWIQDMDYDQYRPAAPYKNKLVLTHVLLQSLGLDS